MISKVDSTQLRGMAIILVLGGHLISAKVIPLASELRYFASFSVSVFLMLSGYGLVKSYLKSGLDKFFIKRFSSVVLPFIITTIILYAFSYYEKHNLLTLLKTITFTQFDIIMDGTMWYVYYIVFIYLLFFLVFSIPIHIVGKVILLFVLSVYVFLFFSDINLQRISFQFSLHSFSFAIGSLLAIVNLKWHIRIVLLVITLIGFFYSYSLLISKYSLFSYMMSAILFGVGSFLLFSLSLFSIKILSFIGAISYEIYLLEGFFLWRLFPTSIELKVSYFFGVTILLAYFLHQFNCWLQYKVNSKFY